MRQSGAHNPERATSMRSFSRISFFRTVLVRILYIFQIPQISQQNLET